MVSSTAPVGRALHLGHLAFRASAILVCLTAVVHVEAASATDPYPARVATSRGEFQLLVHEPPEGASAPGAARPLVLLISGEGGWRAFDVLVAGWLREAGFWVGGVDIKPYFQKPQDDRRALSADFRAYAAALADAAGVRPDTPVILAGFSFGADLAPWIAGAGGWEKTVRGLVMIGPDETGSLEYRLLEILGAQPTSHVFSVADALESAAAFPVLFLHASDDRTSAAPALAERFRGARKLAVVPEAGHHFAGHEAELQSALLEGLEWLSRARAQAPPRSPAP